MVHVITTLMKCWTDEKFLKSRIILHKIERKLLLAQIIRLKDVLFDKILELAELRMQ